jgi:AcrR family transcriptional regulator
MRAFVVVVVMVGTFRETAVSRRMYTGAGVCVKIHETDMSTESQKRPYRKKRRARLEDETRLRITESAMELHGSVGPARTSISAVAERAGVRRSTVYRHFAHEAALFDACGSHWARLNPVPDPAPWREIADPDERARRGLTELYAFYARSERMLENVLRDEPVVPSIQRPVTAFRRRLDEVVAVLAEGRPPRTAVPAVLGHAVDFSTWQSLTRRHGLGDAEAAELMTRLVASA